MGDFAQIFGGLLHSANERTAEEKKKFETQRDADVAMYRQIMMDPHAGLGPDADVAAVEERRSKIAGDIAKLQNLKGKDTPIHHLAEMLNGVRRAVKSRTAGVGGPPVDPGMSAPGAKGAPQAQGTSGGGAPANPVQQDTQRIQDKTQSFASKALAKVSHGLGAGLTALDSAMNPQRRYENQLPPLDTQVIPTAPTRMQEAEAQGKAEAAQKTAAHTNEMKQYRDDLKQANPNMKDEDLDRAVQIKFGGLPKQKIANKKVADPESPTGYSYISYDEATGQVFNKQMGAPSTDSSSVSEQIVLGPDGQMYTVPTYRSTTHPKGGLTPLGGSKAASGAPGSGGAPHSKSTAPAGAKTNLPSLSGSQTAPPKGGRRIGSFIRPQQFNALNQQATAIDEARNSIIGDDPNQVGGLAGDLDVFDNPDSVQRIMQYLGFIEKNVAGEANRAAGSGPFAAAEWYAQLPVTVSNLQQQAQQDLAMQLTPQEQQFVTDYFRVMGTIGGLRAATKMPASRWSFTNLYNELPTPGRVNNKGDAMRRIKNILQETNVVSGHNIMSKPADLSRLDDGGGTKKFRSNGKVYNIPAGMVKEFQKDHPNAVAVQ